MRIRVVETFQRSGWEAFSLKHLPRNEDCKHHTHSTISGPMGMRSTERGLAGKSQDQTPPVRSPLAGPIVDAVVAARLLVASAQHSGGRAVKGLPRTGQEGQKTEELGQCPAALGGRPISGRSQVEFGGGNETSWLRDWRQANRNPCCANKLKSTRWDEVCLSALKPTRLNRHKLCPAGGGGGAPPPCHGIFKGR